MVRRSKVHFVHCLLPKAETVGGADVRVTHSESLDSGLMTLDLQLLRAQLRGSKLLDALRLYRQGEDKNPSDLVNLYRLERCALWEIIAEEAFRFIQFCTLQTSTQLKVLFI